VLDPPEEAVLDGEVADVVHPAVAAALADEAVDCVAPAELPVVDPEPGVWSGADDVLSVVCVALPSVPWPRCGPVPPFSTVELAEMIAWRKG
jgi:hypothetical protein